MMTTAEWLTSLLARAIAFQSVDERIHLAPNDSSMLPLLHALAYSERSVIEIRTRQGCAASAKTAGGLGN